MSKAGREESWSLRMLPPLGVLAFFLLSWEALVRWYDVPAYLLPPPSAVWAAALEHLALLTRATLLTAAGALGGFVASVSLGVMLALLFSQSRWIERSFFPYAVFLQTVPIVAIAPLIILWFGTGFQSVVLVACIVSIFPIITNTTAGLTSVPRPLLELFEVHNASRAQVLFRLRLPYAVPSLVTGARISSGLSVIGAIVGEFFAGFSTQHQGLGYIIILTSGQLKTAWLFAAIGASTALGWLIFSSVGWLGDRLTAPWRDV
ncbi:MAG: ABC transporter permease [Myxococcota bacterium]